MYLRRTGARRKGTDGVKVLKEPSKKNEQTEQLFLTRGGELGELNLVEGEKEICAEKELTRGWDREKFLDWEKGKLT